MSRVDGGDFGWAAEQARRALEAAQVDAQRRAELEQARQLAANALPGCDPQNPEGPVLLGQALAQAQAFVPEVRAAFASELARSPRSSRVPPPARPSGSWKRS